MEAGVSNSSTSSCSSSSSSSCSSSSLLAGYRQLYKWLCHSWWSMEVRQALGKFREVFLTVKKRKNTAYLN